MRCSPAAMPFGPSSVIFQVARTEFLKQNEDAVRGFLADYVTVAQLVLRQGATAAKQPSWSAGVRTKSPKEVLDSYFATGSDLLSRSEWAACLPVAIQKPIDAMVEGKLIPRPVDAAKYLALSYLPRPCST